jgi:N-acyl-D-aspartate/D-glutamate deacylase
MTYDLLIKNGRVVDGSGTPAFHADVGIRNGKIADIGKLRGTAKRTIDAKGAVVAPGFIDSHCHYDAQVTWDPLCTYSCYHGATTVIFGNCSLALAPVRKGEALKAKEFLSYVEAIPMDTLNTVNIDWESMGEYMDTLDKRLGVNVGTLMGHSPVRHYVMGEDSQSDRLPTADEVKQMQKVVREGMEAGALGLSFSMSPSHYDPHGVLIPSSWAKEEEVFALCDVLGEMGTGVIEAASGRDAEEKSGLMSRISERTGRTVVYNQLTHQLRSPERWKDEVKRINESVAKGLRAIPNVCPLTVTTDFTMHNCQVFRGVPTFHPIQLAPDEVKLQKYADPAVRKALHEELVEMKTELKNNRVLGKNWPDTIWVQETMLEKNKQFEGKSLRELAEMQGKGIIDAFLDLAVEEKLDTKFQQGVQGYDKKVMSELLNYPNAIIGLSDSGAHVQFRVGYGYSSVLLGHWVRKHQVMSLEKAVKKLTFDQAHTFGIYDRGMLRPGMAADMVIFDPDTIDALPLKRVDDLPGGGWRMEEKSVGVHYTVVNGQVLLEDGKHTGALPGKVMRNSLYQQRVNA